MNEKNKNGNQFHRLPPHNFEAEQGVLGCCLLDAANIRTCLERFAVEGGRTREVFYDLRHQLIFEVLCWFAFEEKPVDIITVTDELRKRQVLEQVGGIPYLSALEGATPSSHNLESYLGIVWEKYIARQFIARTTTAQSAIYDMNGITEGGIAHVEQELKDWTTLATRSRGITPQDLKRPADFGDGVFNLWFKKNKEEEGWEIPFSFPWKVRRNEMTLVGGEDGSGKSIFTGQLAVNLIKQGLRGCIASLEVPSDKTLWMLTRQVLGQGPFLWENEQNMARVAKAMAFLNSGIWLYDFVGITEWRHLLDVFRYAREKEAVDFFILDSVMRIGIPEDDLATQSLAAAEFAGFTVQTGAHLFVVHHFNKSKEGGIKAKITGSKRWSDNSNNVTEMRRNYSKGKKVSELLARLESKQIDEKMFEEEMAKLRTETDATFLLDKQRYAGSIQNGSKHLWFDHGSLQYRDQMSQGNLDYLLK
jgi:replicative DNA helicase